MACSWCQSTLSCSASCTCDEDCGKPECPNGSDREFYTGYPVPEFVTARSRVDAPVLATDLGEPMPTDLKSAVERVLRLHAQCPCKGCSAGVQRPSCKGCSDFWPCGTVLAVRGVTAR